MIYVIRLDHTSFLSILYFVLLSANHDCRTEHVFGKCTEIMENALPTFFSSFPEVLE